MEIATFPSGASKSGFFTHLVPQMETFVLLNIWSKSGCLVFSSLALTTSVHSTFWANTKYTLIFRISF